MQRVRPKLLSSSSGCGVALQQRSLSHSIYNPKLGPESPDYIEVPEPPQSRFSQPLLPKGFLPVPRNVFPKTRQIPERISDAAIDRKLKLSTPEPTIESSKEPFVHTQQLAFKARAAEFRRRNLREGTRELLVRRRVADAKANAKSNRLLRAHESAINAPEREDERLTRPSVPYHLQRPVVLKNPGQASRLREKKANVARQEKKESENRREALHTLYMHARDFLTTIEDVDAEVEKVFGTDEQPARFGVEGVGQSVWDLGNQVTVQEMIRRKPGTLHRLMQNTDDSRMKRIMEELTGGKIDDQAQI